MRFHGKSSVSEPKKGGPHSFVRSKLLFFVFPLFFFLLETVLHLLLFGTVTARFLLYTVLLSVPAGLICALLSSFGGPGCRTALFVSLTGVFTLYAEVQLVYCKYFKDFFYWDLLRIAGDAMTGFGKEALGTIRTNLLPILLLLLPFALCAVFGKKIAERTEGGWKPRIAAGLTAALLFLAGIGAVNADGGQFGDRHYYHEGFLMSQGMSRFGLVTSLRLDTRYTLFGHDFGGKEDVPAETHQGWEDVFGTEAEETEPPLPETAPEETDAPGTEPREDEPTTGPTDTGVPETEPPVTDPPETEPPLPPVDTSPNVMEIDFPALINGAWSDSLRAAHTYFSGRTPTNKNEYTGMFAGKNLIFITVEAWAPAAISEKLTPTLWKMKNEGFRFDNYFCSVWGGSTATGEYANITGNFYRSAGCFWITRNKLEKFTLGNMLGREGYSCYAFHNYKHDYYYRDRSHPNFGYEWLALGNWDKTPLFTPDWPPSDRELAENTLSYIPTDGTPFHFYYMTVSGHGCQTFYGQRQSARHKDEVLSAGLDYVNEECYSYLAAQIEVELMVRTLCDYLEANGLLENTVFVMAPDHYPYMITDKSDDVNREVLSELYGLPAENIYMNYELYRAPLVIWSPSMKEPVTVKKVCSAPDILPTVLNLFGLEYDSRLIIGRDILSDCEGFVPLNMSNAGSVASNDNWLTDYGFYSTTTKQFTPFPGITVREEQLPAYVSYYNDLLLTLSRYSNYILENDYYRSVFPNG